MKFRVSALSWRHLAGFSFVIALVLPTSGSMLGAIASLKTKNTFTSRNTAIRAEPLTEQSRPVSRIKSELITVGPYGFEPREISRPAGRFLLVIENRSHIETLVLRFSKEDGSNPREIRVPRTEPEWSGVVDLRPGRYLITEANHTHWECRITITQP